MEAILLQLGLDRSFFALFGVFAVLFVVISNVYFKPFLKLFEYRDRRTVQDREAAEKLMAHADAKFEDYRKRLSEERAAALKSFEMVMSEAKKEEAAIISNARGEAKKITQDAADSVSKQREQLGKQLQADVENLAKSISETLLARK